MKTTPWDTSELLDTEEEIAMYLSVVFEEGDPEGIAMAIGHVAKARSMTEIAKRAGISRKQLYRALQEGGDPNVITLADVMSSLGVKPTAESTKPRKVGRKAAVPSNKRVG